MLFKIIQVQFYSSIKLIFSYLSAQIHFSSFVWVKYLIAFLLVLTLFIGIF